VSVADPHDRADALLDVVEGEEEIGSPNLMDGAVRSFVDLLYAMA
jgi:hypothetical protein